MGCCTSRPSSSTSSTHEPSTSTAALPQNALTPSQTNTSATHSNLPREPPPTGPRLNRIPPHHHIFRPETTKHYEPGSSRLPPLTRRELDGQRQAYFETGVGLGGSPEIWAALATVCEEFRHGDIDEASAILGAMGCTVPTGNLWGTRTRGGVWDEGGIWYAIPDWCLGDPEGVVDEDDDVEGKEEEVEVVVRDRGKGPAKRAGEGEKMMRVRTRLSHVARDVVITLGEEDNVGILVERVREVASLPEDTRIKISYLGTILHEDKTLLAQGWKEGQVISAYIFLSSG